jgi:hypothetical protein
VQDKGTTEATGSCKQLYISIVVLVVIIFTYLTLLYTVRKTGGYWSSKTPMHESEKMRITEPGD